MAARKKAAKKPARKAARRAASPLGGRSVKSAPKKSAGKTAKRKPFHTPDGKPIFPRIGARWAGGSFMGIGAGEEKQPDYLLVRGRYAPRKMNHADAVKFAEACRDGGHSDWDLANQTDGWLIQANGRKDMRGGWHWLKPQSAPIDAFAWCQHFVDGNQLFGLKSTEFEVVLVRRVPIQ